GQEKQLHKLIQEQEKAQTNTQK
ncbi:ankyrin repeat domain-containing protein, partial [Salmonella enterica subsp. enterica]|nr:ankyrin repeat domain-containing protein [Salmonella enterica subsp. enterica]